MIKFVFKWVFRLVMSLVILVILAVIIFLLTYNSILRAYIEHNIRAQTGLEAEIGRFNLSLTQPTIEIQNFELFNPTNFGGAPFLDLPEIHIEYDLSALSKRELHFTFVRFKLGELDIVKNQSGQLNILAMSGATPEVAANVPPQTQRLGAPPAASPPSPGSAPAPPKTSTAAPPPPPRPTSPAPSVNLEEQTGYEFTGIDKLNVSFEKEKFIDLKNPTNDFEQTVGLEDCIVPHVKTMNDLGGLILLIDLKSNHFFERIVGGGSGATSPDQIRNALNALGL
jgi:hypothetical protein